MFLIGDIGFVDKDRRLHIVDRKKNIIYCSEGNIFPSAIENVLLRSNDIAAACVVGVPNGPILEAPAAVVVRSLNSNITVDDIHKMVEGKNSRLSSQTCINMLKNINRIEHSKFTTIFRWVLKFQIN